MRRTASGRDGSVFITHIGVRCPRGKHLTHPFTKVLSTLLFSMARLTNEYDTFLNAVEMLKKAHITVSVF